MADDGWRTQGGGGKKAAGGGGGQNQRQGQGPGRGGGGDGDRNRGRGGNRGGGEGNRGGQAGGRGGPNAGGQRVGGGEGNRGGGRGGPNAGAHGQRGDREGSQWNDWREPGQSSSRSGAGSGTRAQGFAAGGIDRNANQLGQQGGRGRGQQHGCVCYNCQGVGHQSRDCTQPRGNQQQRSSEPRGGPSHSHSQGGNRGGQEMQSDNRRDRDSYAPRGGDRRDSYAPSGGGRGTQQYSGHGGSGGGPVFKVFTPDNEKIVIDENQNIQMCRNGWQQLPPPAPVPQDKKLSRSEIVKLESKSLKLPARQKDDEKLRETKATVRLRTNHFPVAKIKLPKVLVQYEVVIKRAPRVVKDKDKERPGPSKPKKNKKQPPPGGAGGDGDAGNVPELRLPRDLRRRILQRAVETMKNDYLAQNKKDNIGIITDFGSQVWSTRKLQGQITFEDREVNMQDILNYDRDFEGDGIFLITIRETNNIIDTSPYQEMINDLRILRGVEDTEHFFRLKNVYNILLKNMANEQFTLTGRSNLILRPDNYGAQLGQGLVCWNGLTTLFEFGWKPYINFDMANSVFVLGATLFETIDDFFGRLRRIEKDRGNPGDLRELNYGQEDPRDVRNWDDWTRSKLLELLRTCKVKYSPKRGVTRDGGITQICGSVSNEYFIWEEQGNREISVYNYFKEKYNNTLKYPHGLCIKIKDRFKIPAELCILKSGQSYNRKLTAEQTTEMLNVAKKNPQELTDYIERRMRELLTQKAEGLLESFGVSTPGKMLVLDKTRILDPPTLCYGNGKYENEGKKALIEPKDGTWEIWQHEFRFYSSEPVKKWAIYAVNNRCNWNHLETFRDHLLHKADQRSMTFPANPEILIENTRLYEDRHRDCVTRFRDQFQTIVDNFAVKKEELKNCFILVVIPKKGSKHYHQVKQAAELHVGILTQCIVEKNIENGKLVQSIAGNIMLKLNSKLRGINHVVVFPEKFKNVNILQEPVLVLGADVTHPPPGVPGVKASFAAITALVDRTGMPYMMHIQAQEKAERGAAEVITNLDDVIEKMLLAFQKYSRGFIPTKIIYFRDGVGDGQFQELLHVEMLKIRQACTRVSERFIGGQGYEPKITFITVQKRHKTRFFMEDYDYKGNVEIKNAPPGTVVDSEIVHPVEIDFYLLSHKGLLGTSRPTRYHVLWDDSGFKIEEIQVLAYFLCFMFVRCNRSVKIPAPTYYSHWAAQRAKSLTEKVVNENLYRNQDNTYDNARYVADLNRILYPNPERRREGFYFVTEIGENNPMHFV